MGNLYGVDLRELVDTYKLDCLVETGTGHGQNLVAALQVPQLVDLRSIEIDAETHARARATFLLERRVTLYHGDSPLMLPSIARAVTNLRRRAIWFLDAHFPGSGRMQPVPMRVNGDGERKVPILAELHALRERNLSRDVIVIDDLCLFERGEYEVDAPELRAALGMEQLGARLAGILASTHDVCRSNRDGGYLIALPK